jgi:hypothetical protein
MRRALLAALAVATAACTTPCQELGHRICTCTPAGTQRDTCDTQIDNQLNNLGQTSAEKGFCSEKLGTCNAPAGASFCDWINTDAAKVACGVAFPPPASSTTP